MGNWLEDFDNCGFKEMNDPKVTNNGDGTILFSCGPGNDLFQDPTGKFTSDDAPFLYKEIEGDFVCTVCGEHDFVALYDCFSILAFDNPKLFASIMYEAMDNDAKSIINVVTRGFSDDSRGWNLPSNEVWLRMTREGNIFTTEFSENGKDYTTARFFSLDMPDVIKVGITTQSTVGEGTTALIKYFEIT